MNLSHSQFAEKLRVAMSTLYSWENGTRNIPNSIKLLLEFYLAAIYEVSSSHGNFAEFGAVLGFNSRLIRNLEKLPKKGTKLYHMGYHYKRLHYKVY